MVYFILDIFSDTFLDIFFGQIFCARTLTVYIIYINILDLIIV